jgi:eukaryotic-like serine/threonine-protein kinase
VLATLLVLGGSGFLLVHATGWPANTGKHVTAAATSNSVLYTATARANQQATARAIAEDPYLSGKLGKLLLSDPLSQPANWKPDASGSGGGLCFFKNGAYHVEQSLGTDTAHICATSTLRGSNFIYEVQMSVQQGTCGGIDFRYNLSPKKIETDYNFRICTDGDATLRIVTSAGIATLFNGYPSAIKRGLQQHNTIAVAANGSQINLYVNKRKIASIVDINYTTGSFALFAADHNQPTEIAFTNARIWQL